MRKNDVDVDGDSGDKEDGDGDDGIRNRRCSVTVFVLKREMKIRCKSEW